MDAPAEVPAPRSIWIRDFALVGGLTSVLAPASALMTEPAYLAVAGIAGAVSGLVLGAILAWAQPQLRRAPMWFVFPLAMSLGAVWGGTVGGAAGMVFLDSYRAWYWSLSVVCAAVAGALQLGWFYLPYAVTAAQGRSTRLLVIIAVGLAAVFGRMAVTVAVLL